MVRVIEPGQKKPPETEITARIEGWKGQAQKDIEKAKTEKRPESSEGHRNTDRGQYGGQHLGKPSQGSCHSGSSKISRNPPTALCLAWELPAHSGCSDGTTSFSGGPRNNGASSEPALTRPRQPGVVATSRRRGGHTGAEAARGELRCQPQSGSYSRNDPRRGPRQQGHRAPTTDLPMANGLPWEPARHPYSVRPANLHPPPLPRRAAQTVRERTHACAQSLCRNHSIFPSPPLSPPRPAPPRPPAPPFLFPEWHGELVPLWLKTWGGEGSRRGARGWRARNTEW